MINRFSASLSAVRWQAQLASAMWQVGQSEHSTQMSASILCRKSGLPMVLQLGINVVNAKLQSKKNYELTTRRFNVKVRRRINGRRLVIKTFKPPP